MTNWKEDAEHLASAVRARDAAYKKFIERPFSINAFQTNNDLKEIVNEGRAADVALAEALKAHDLLVATEILQQYN